MPGQLDPPKNNLAGEVPVAEDPRRAPNGIYSGMTKRLAISDNDFAEVQNRPKPFVHPSQQARKLRED